MRTNIINTLNNFVRILQQKKLVMYLYFLYDDISHGNKYHSIQVISSEFSNKRECYPQKSKSILSNLILSSYSIVKYSSNIHIIKSKVKLMKDVHSKLLWPRNASSSLTLSSKYYDTFTQLY